MTKVIFIPSGGFTLTFDGNDGGTYLIRDINELKNIIITINVFSVLASNFTATASPITVSKSTFVMPWECYYPLPSELFDAEKLYSEYQYISGRYKARKIQGALSFNNVQEEVSVRVTYDIKSLKPLFTFVVNSERTIPWELFEKLSYEDNIIFSGSKELCIEPSSIEIDIDKLINHANFVRMIKLLNGTNVVIKNERCEGLSYFHKLANKNNIQITYHHDENLFFLISITEKMIGAAILFAVLFLFFKFRSVKKHKLT